MATTPIISPTPKKWIGVDVAKNTANTVKRVLRAENVRYEASSCGDDVHLEILTTESDMAHLMNRAGLVWDG